MVLKKMSRKIENGTKKLWKVVTGAGDSSVRTGFKAESIWLWLFFGRVRGTAIRLFRSGSCSGVVWNRNGAVPSVLRQAGEVFQKEAKKELKSENGRGRMNLLNRNLVLI